MKLKKNDILYEKNVSFFPTLSKGKNVYGFLELNKNKKQNNMNDQL